MNWKIKPLFYEILNVSETSTNEEIDKAYKNLASKMHPDISGSQYASEKFIAVQRAYNILGNTKKRKKYDAENGIFNSKSKSLKNSDSYSFENSDSYSFENSDSCMYPLDSRNLGNYKPENINVTMDVSFEDIYNGVVKNIKFNKKVICAECGGRKIDVKKCKQLTRKGRNFTCGKCKGSGNIDIIHMSGHARLAIPVICDRCGGDKIILRPEIICTICCGLGLIDASDTIRIDMSSDILRKKSFYFTHESTLTIYRIGNQTIPRNDKIGSVIVHINELRNYKFIRSLCGRDLLFVHKISLYEALGCKKSRTVYIKNIPSNLIISIPDEKIIKPGQIKKIIGKGPFGDIYVLFDIYFPDKINVEISLINAYHFNNCQNNNKFEDFNIFDKNINFVYDNLEDIKMSNICSKFNYKS